MALVEHSLLVGKPLPLVLDPRSSLYVGIRVHHSFFNALHHKWSGRRFTRYSNTTNWPGDIHLRFRLQLYGTRLDLNPINGIVHLLPNCANLISTESRTKLLTSVSISRKFWSGIWLRFSYPTNRRGDKYDNADHLCKIKKSVFTIK